MSAQMNPLDTFLAEYGSEKTSNIIGDVGRYAKGLFQGAGGSPLADGQLPDAHFLGRGAAGKAAPILLAAAAGAVALGGLAAAKKIYGAIEKKKQFKTMMELHPALEERRAAEPAFFTAAYDSLHRINPTFAKDPVVAGTLMTRMMSEPTAAGMMLADTVAKPQAGGTSFGLSGGKIPLGPLSFGFNSPRPSPQAK